MTFSMHSKAAEDFVGECNKPFPSQGWPPNPVLVEESCPFQSPPLPVNVEGSCGRDGVKIDSVLAQAKSAIPPRLARSPSTSSPFTACSHAPKEKLQTISQEVQATFHSPTNSPRSSSKIPIFPSPSFSSATTALAGASRSGKPPIIMSSFDTTAEATRPTYASRFQSHFFAQSSGNYVPPIEISCSFFPCCRFLTRALSSAQEHVLSLPCQFGEGCQSSPLC